MATTAGAIPITRSVKLMLRGIATIYYGMAALDAYDAASDLEYKLSQKTWKKVYDAQVTHHHFQGNKYSESHELIEYKFEYEGKEYEGLHTNQEFTTTRQTSQERFFTNFPIGKRVSIYVNPEDPFETQLSRMTEGPTLTPNISRNLLSAAGMLMMGYGFQKFNVAKIVLGFVAQPNNILWKKVNESGYFGEALNNFFGYAKEHTEEVYSHHHDMARI